jgi:nitroreductase
MIGSTEGQSLASLPPKADFTNPALENIYARRSIRNFTDDRVPNEVIGEIMRAGTFAPTATNQQPWRFVVIRNREVIDRIGRRSKELWAELYKDATDPRLASLYRIMTRPEMDVFYGAPVLILVFSAPGTLSGETDCALAAENMMLAARSLGVGSCWIGLARVAGTDRELMQEIGVPEGYTLAAPLIFGYPLKDYTRAPARNSDVLLKWID